MKTTTLFLWILTISASIATAQPFNIEVITEENPPELLGKINKEALSAAPYDEWFDKNFEDYQPAKEVIEQVKDELSQYTITIFLGTWCGDSKREVPRFYKILDACDFPLERLTTVAVSRDRDVYKQSPGGEQEGLNIHRVPTFIFYKNGKEVNRIVEYPVETLEKDMLQILQKKEYISSYNSVTIVNNALNKMGSEKFQKKAKKLLPQLKNETKKTSELNTYASVLFFSDRQEEAITVARLNVKLFPEEAYVYESLANKLYRTSKFGEALSNYETALRLDPENVKLIETIKELKAKV